MNPLTTVLPGLISQLWWLLPFLLLAALLKSSTFKGWLGELGVRLISHFALDRSVYHRLHNLTLPTPDGTTQIDHVLVSVYGIFVIETKNMQGWIFGSERQATWTQKIYRKNFKFQNPLRQNYKHMKAIESALDIPPDKVHSVISFIGGTLKTDLPGNVTEGSGFVAYIKSFQVPVFTEEQVTAFMKTLSSRALTPSLQTHRAHVQNLKLRSNPDAVRTCPKCGSRLVIRTTRKGQNQGKQFWGCSNFPTCRIRQEIS